MLHGFRTVRETLDPLFATYYAMPIFAFYPLFILIFGLGDGPQVLIGFLLGVVAVIVTILNGLDRVPRVLRKTALIGRLGPVETALHVTLPFCAPYLLTAAKLALAYAFIGVIGSEFIMARSGMGYEIGFAYTNFDNATMYPLIVLILLAFHHPERRADALGESAARPTRPAMMDEGRKPLRNTVVLIVGLLVIWQAHVLVVGDVAMRSPWQTMRSTVSLRRPNRSGSHVQNTMRAFAAALAIAVVLGLLIGFALGLHRLSAEAMEPMLVSLYSIPKITLYPIILLVFGLGMSAKVAFGAIHGIIPVALFTLDAVRSTRPISSRPGACSSSTRRQMVRWICFPRRFRRSLPACASASR